MRNEKFFVNFFKAGLKPGTIRLRRKDRWIESKIKSFVNLFLLISLPNYPVDDLGRKKYYLSKYVFREKTFLLQKFFP